MALRFELSLTTAALEPLLLPLNVLLAPAALQLPILPRFFRFELLPARAVLKLPLLIGVQLALAPA